MSAKADIDFTALMAAVGGMTRNLSDATRALPVIAESLVSHVQDVFEKEGAVPGHAKWPPLSPATIRRRRGGALKKLNTKGGKRLKSGKFATKAQLASERANLMAGGGTFKILQDTGVLAASIAPASGGTWVEAFTNVPYAVYHVSKEPRRVIPLRDFFAIDEKSFYADAAETILAIIGKGMR